MDNPVLVKIVHRAKYLEDYVSPLTVAQLDFLFVDQIIKRTEFNELCDNGKIWGDATNANQKDYVGMPKLSQHVNLIAQLEQKLLAHFGVKHFFDSHF